MKCAVDSVLPLENFPRDGLRESDHVIYHLNRTLESKRAVINYSHTTVINQD